MVAHLDLDPKVARPPAETGDAAALDAQHLAVLHPRRDVDLEAAAVGRGHPPASAAHGLHEIERELEPHLARGVPEGPAEPEAAGPAPASAAAEELADDVLETAEIAAPAEAAGARPGLPPEAAGDPLPPLLVDLAAIVAGPLVAIAENLVGGGDALEHPFGRPVAGVEIGMVLLGEAPVGGADLRVAGGSGDAQNVVETVGHARSVAESRDGPRRPFPRST